MSSPKSAVWRAGQKGIVGKLRVTPSLNERLEGIEDQAQREKIYQEFKDHMDDVIARFIVMFPHIPLDSSEAGLHNQKTIAEWMNDHGAGAELENFTAAIHDVYRSLKFDPSLAGRSDLGHLASGQFFENKLNSADWDWLLQPHAPYARADVYEPEKSAAAYKKAHPEGWKIFAHQVTQADAAFVTEQVAQFLRLRPAFISNDENRKMLLAAVKDAGLKINQTSLMLCHDNLVKSGKMQTNEDVSFKLPGITRTDFAEATGDESGRASRLSKDQEAALKFVKSHSSKEIVERMQKDPVFRAALDRLNS